MPPELRNIISDARDDIWLFLRQEQPKIVKLQSDKFFQDLEQALEIFSAQNDDRSAQSASIVSLKNHKIKVKKTQSERVEPQTKYASLVTNEYPKSTDCQQSLNDNHKLSQLNRSVELRNRRRSPEAVFNLLDHFAIAWERATDSKPRRVSGHKTPFVEAAKLFLNLAGINKPETYLRQFLTQLENE
ncbi:MAG: hypothetical protein RLZZ496_1594 [Pseudomonadota bacterium]